MKKLISVVLVLALCLSFTACDTKARDYEAAEALFAAKDYEAATEAFTALEDYEDAADRVLECRYAIADRAYEAKAYEKALGLFQELGDYKDSADKAKECDLRIGMKVNADSKFLSELEERTTDRLDTGVPEWGSFDYFLEEMEAFKKYETETFYNPRIAELYQSYVDGLEIHKSSLATINYQTSQERMMEGVRLQYMALTEFYEDYGFMDEMPTYKKLHYDQQVKFLTAYDGYVTIREDVETQFRTLLETEELYVLQEATENSGECRITLTNNTQYNYSGLVVFTLRDVNGVTLTEGDFMLVGPLEPGASHEFTVPTDKPDRFWDFTYNIIISDVDGYTVG